MIAPWHWAAFVAFLVVILTVDLGVLNRRSRETGLREASISTAIWCLLAVAFNLLIWQWLGTVAAQEFFTGYVIEWTLSMDNVFVFAVIFTFFRVPRKYQHRVLFWGILGAVVMRLTFILVGKELIQQFGWILPILGLFLIYTGIKLSMKGDSEVHPDKNILLRVARKFFPVAREDHGSRFFCREQSRWCVTPLFLVLLVVESTDVVFAVDSVPAIFGVVDQKAHYFTFVVFSSNVFAILGLRSLYFLLAGAMDAFRYLSYGLSAILVFVGVKMVAQYLAVFFNYLPQGEHLIAPWVSLVVVVGVLAVSIVASIAVRAAERRRKHLPRKAPQGK